jgi:hypothetical protein
MSKLLFLLCGVGCTNCELWFWWRGWYLTVSLAHYTSYNLTFWWSTHRCGLIEGSINDVMMKLTLWWQIECMGSASPACQSSTSTSYLCSCGKFYKDLFLPLYVHPKGVGQDYSTTQTQNTFLVVLSTSAFATSATSATSATFAMVTNRSHFLHLKFILHTRST